MRRAVTVQEEGCPQKDLETEAPSDQTYNRERLSCNSATAGTKAPFRSTVSGLRKAMGFGFGLKDGKSDWSSGRSVCAVFLMGREKMSGLFILTSSFWRFCGLFAL